MHARPNLKKHLSKSVCLHAKVQLLIIHKPATGSKLLPVWKELGTRCKLPSDSRVEPVLRPGLARKCSTLNRSEACNWFQAPSSLEGAWNQVQASEQLQVDQEIRKSNKEHLSVKIPCKVVALYKRRTELCPCLDFNPLPHRRISTNFKN